jgi:CDP-diacylglycerol--glycerol-3-phosphate 3-phosphatidyltransferase
MNVIPQRVKDGFVRLTGPLARALIAAGLHPNTISTLGTVIVVGSGVAFSRGSVRLGGLLLLCSGLFDILDGQVARLGAKTTTFGAFYDSTLDRVGEGAVFTGLTLYFLTGSLPADLKPRAVAACLVALIASLLVSYTRARAEALGVENRVGIAARAERVLLLGLPALGFGAGPGPGHQGVLLFWIVTVLAIVSTITVIQRVVHVARVARGAPPPSPIQKRETLPGVAAGRRKGH